MSSFIRDIIAKTVGNAVYTSTQSYSFKPDPSPVDAVIGGPDKVSKRIGDADDKAQLQDPTNQITTWTTQMRAAVDDLNKTSNSDDSLANYNNIVTALNDPSTGIRVQTFAIYSAVMGKDGIPLGTDALLSSWVQTAYAKLSDETNLTYFMQNFIDDLENNIAAVFAVLQHGLELSFFAAADATDADRLQSECWLRVVQIQNSLFRLYPRALRNFKSNNYDDTGAYFTANWFNLLVDSGSGTTTTTTTTDGTADDDTPPSVPDQWVIIDDSWTRTLKLASGGQIRAFQFVPEGKPFGPVQLNAYWKAAGNARVKYYDGKPDNITPFKVFTNNPRDDAIDILFKVIPVDGDSTNVRDLVKLVAYQDGTTNAVGDDDNGLMANTFILGRSAVGDPDVNAD